MSSTNNISPAFIQRKSDFPSLSTFILFALLFGFVFLPDYWWLLAFAGLFVYHIDVCIGLTHDAFIRFSRFKLSQKHPVLNIIISVLFILVCFVGLSPLALFFKAYSLAVSPDHPEQEASTRWFQKQFMKPLIHGFILSVATLYLIFVP